ncbi:MAG TPA: class I SAM-dependent methyltransferase, partial [Campylobacteraceae bacterium]|nr:class I SAM-dependent methyltransferase [Campylobacteraceae bacterium]
TLNILMEKCGFSMDIYDCFYAPDETVFKKRYDFITSTEVIEHLHDPMGELTRLWTLLKPDGVLGIMTAFRVEDFADWYYKRDLTHIRFFTPKTFEWIAKKLGAQLEIPQSGVILLHKK